MPNRKASARGITVPHERRCTAEPLVIGDPDDDTANKALEYVFAATIEVKQHPTPSAQVTNPSAP